MTDKRNDMMEDDSAGDQDDTKRSRRALQDCSNTGELSSARQADHASELSTPGTSDAQQVREQTQPGGVVAVGAAEFATVDISLSFLYSLSTHIKAMLYPIVVDSHKLNLILT